jgi:hypothetical protein
MLNKKKLTKSIWSYGLVAFQCSTKKNERKKASKLTIDGGTNQVALAYSIFSCIDSILN